MMVGGRMGMREGEREESNRSLWNSDFIILVTGFYLLIDQWQCLCLIPVAACIIRRHLCL